MKKINITTAVLVIYLIVMSVLGWPGKEPDADYLQYGFIIGISLIVIFLLRYFQIKRFKVRQQYRNESNNKS